MPLNYKRPISLTPDQLKALPISIGEARKLLGITTNISDEDVAQEILRASELARATLKTLELTK